MPSKMILLFGVPMFVGGCAILWIYWDHFKKPKKKIFISADCWLSVFELLEPSQLGLGIAMISHRFDFYVDEHFKTRKWALKFILIQRKIGENGTKEMEIVNFDGETMPIPKMQLPRKLIGFKWIIIQYIDQNAIAFLRRLYPLFGSCPIHLIIRTDGDRILEFIMHNIWPMIAKNICGLYLMDSFGRLRKFFPSILNDCPLLRVVTFYATANLFTEFPADDNATASDGQALAKWLFTPLQSNVPKMLRCPLDMDDGTLASNIEAFKAAFASASTPATFIVVTSFPRSFADSVVPFVLTNELTREQLAFKRATNDTHYFLLVRCPIARDESKWTKLEEEAIGWRIDNQWDQIDVQINDEDDVGDGLIAATPGPSDQQQK